MVELTKDKKSPALIITKTDEEGFHQQMSLTEDEMRELYDLWIEYVLTGGKNE